jgi:hypothetical protein
MWRRDQCRSRHWRKTMLFRFKIEPIYTVNTLPPDTKEKVLENFRELNIQDDWYSYVYESWQEKLKRQGYDDIRISFNGFGSQGDGASFTANVDVERYIKAHQLGNQYRALLNAAKQGEVTVAVKRLRYYYVHEKTVAAYGETGVHKETVQQQLESLVDKVTAEVCMHSRQIYDALNDEYNALISDEAVLDALYQDDYLFTADGNRVTA